MQERDIGFQPNPKDEMNDLAVNGGVSKDEGAQQAEESVSREGINPPIFYVGIGASAGGLEALESFFTHMATDSHMAFIVIQHLSPNYKSMMVELLSKRTAMAVRRAEEGMLVEENSVYLIPPKKNLSIFHGKL